MMVLKNWKVIAVFSAAIAGLAGCETTATVNSEPEASSSISMFKFWATDSEQDQAALAAIDSATAGELRQLLSSGDLGTVYKAQTTALNAPDAGNRVEWRNRFSGAKGTVKSSPVYFVNDRRCRDYTHTISYDEQTQVIKGSACQQGKTWASL